MTTTAALLAKDFLAAANALFGKKAREIQETMDRLLQDSSAGEGEMLNAVMELAFVTDRVHDSECEPEFYLKFLDYLLESIQEPTPENIALSSALSYLSRVEYVGLAPVYRLEWVQASSSVIGAVAVFDIICQDDKVCPDEVRAYRISVDLGTGKIDARLLDKTFLLQPGDVRVMGALIKQAKKNKHPKIEQKIAVKEAKKKAHKPLKVK